MDNQLHYRNLFNNFIQEEKGIKILGAYVTVTEHDYYIIVEASDYSAVVEFFLPLVPSQTGKFAPVLTMDEWLKIMPK